MKYSEVEIMSPVGSYESLMAAIQGGANSVYFGVEQLNMRSRSSNNFTIEDLVKISAICKENKIKTYITINTILYDNEIELMHSIVDAAKENNISAIIASDISVMEYAIRQNVEVHISTQCNVTNTEAVRFYSRFADVVVTARELNLNQVAKIYSNIEKDKITGPSGKLIQLEIFAHGALCMAVSGKCYLSLDNMNYSANRGACLQLCRKGYTVKDKEDAVELDIDNQYIMSPKDLCTIGFLDRIIEAGVRVLKIEGRGRSPEYVKTVTRCYREAADSIIDGTYSSEKIENWTKQLDSVYNRGFWDGYYLGRKLGEWTEKYGSQATKKKVYIGKITNFFAKLGVAEVKIETNSIKVGDEVLITGESTGVIEMNIGEIRVDQISVNSTKKGELCSIPMESVVRRNDKLYLVTDNRDIDVNS
ncbi:MAG: U32 family peptidase [Bacteroidetes bacterium]|nr:U32 family peptidase [Bacteroidota bacterium]